MEKERLDVLLFKKGYSDSREKARRLIMAGNVLVNGIKEDKPGARFEPSVNIEIKGNEIPYVSRGGLKIEKALKFFNIDLKGKVAIDVGASTGGFTDCMLKNGASRVIAIDVGYGQMAWKLRNDERVKLMERTNIRNIKPGDIEVVADFAAIDVSFISLKKVIPVVAGLIGDKGEIVCLVKPQFEAGREKVGNKGVVRDPVVHLEVLKEIISFVKNNGLYVKGLTYSPVKGPEGNIEYLLYISKVNGSANGNAVTGDDAREVVTQSHDSLDKG
ncbi:MAG: TlyA family RNA methyltransferase [Clostridiaceae bacterium]|nr:TlyA family RNA methyltransferase [Clostridiaceae bacterium]